MLASELITQCQEVLRDQRGDVYTTAQGVKWVNDAQRLVTVLRPDAKSVVENMVLVAATKQTLPAGRRRLLGLTRNMGADGVTVGKAIRGPVPQETLDSFNADWHTAAGSYVEEYVYDEALPKTFFVRPYVATTWYLEAKFAALPTDVADENAAIDLDDIYAPAMREWMLYCYFARDDERTPNYERAGRHFQNTFNILDVKLRRDLAVSPKVLEYS